ncbi:helix-turn-helix transcriptional regulator [Leucobacter chromiireducens]|uniref:helix-turn-helix transcriptional regulator n=1 Tax=Leucobacter chromiireducens TaxID=283877 RepID=UPI0013DE51FB|nr:helix-turn-helix transcriptional regulator [Leucobacter chromiireducens]
MRESGQASLLLPDVGDERPLPSALLAALVEQGRAIPASGVSGPIELAAHMDRAFGGRLLTLVVDGPQALPPLLQAAITHYRVSAPLQIVMLTSSETMMLERSPRAASVQLPLLSLEEIGAVLHGVNGSPLDATTLSRVYAKSGGLVKLAIAITEIATIEGAMKLVDGEWSAVRELWSPRLAPMVRGYAPRTDVADAEALETLALAGLVAATEAVDLVGEPALERLEEDGLIAAEPSGTNHWVTVTPPILGEMLRHRKRPIRQTRIGSQIEEVTSRPLESAETPQREIRLGRVGPLLLRRVAEHRAAVLRTHTIEWEETHDAETGLQLVEVLVDQGEEPGRILTLIESVAALAATPEQRAWLRVWEARMYAYGRRDLARGLAVLADHTDTGAYAGILVAARVRMCVELDAIPVDVEEQLLGFGDAPLAVQIEVQRSLACVHLARGKLAQAERALAALSGRSSEQASAPVGLLEALTALLRGKHERAMRIALAGFEHAKDDLDARSMLSYLSVLSMQIVIRGQSVSVARLNEVVTVLGEPPLFPQLGYLRARVLGVMSVNGSVDEVRALVADLKETHLSGTGAVGVSLAWADAKLAAVAGEPGRAARTSWEDAVDMYRRGGYLAAVQSALLSLTYRYDEPRAILVERWCEGMGSPLFDAQLTYLRARARGDVLGVLAVLPALKSTGQTGFVMQAYRELTQSPDVQGDSRLAARVAQERDVFSASLENGGLDLLQVVVAEAKLTPREEEVARLIAGGMTNRQIQEELVLSIRTVENHVHRLMRKLRASTRQEVVEAVHSWATHEGDELR